MKKRFVLMIFPVLVLISACELPQDDPAASPAKRLEGSWTVDETSSVYKSALDIYQVYIYADPVDSTRVLIENFYQLGRDMEIWANIDGNSILIPYQVEDGFRINGFGTVSANYSGINFLYTVDDGSGEIDEVSAVFTKSY
jgi:hypothetical protein